MSEENFKFCENHDILETLRGQKDYIVNPLSWKGHPEIQDAELVVSILAKGFYPKCLFAMLYQQAANIDRNEFYMALEELKEQSHVMLVTDKDAHRNIFAKGQCWYFLPYLVFELSFETPVEKPLIPLVHHAVYQMKSVELMPWLACLVIHFFLAHTIVINKNQCHGKVGKKQIFIDMDYEKKTCEFSLYSSGNDEEGLLGITNSQWIVILIRSIYDQLNRTPILKKNLTMIA